MKGLTAEERATLERWLAREYVVVDVEPGPLPSIDLAVAHELFRRELAMWEAAGFFARRAVPSPLGMIALRADAAAREQGLWPR